MNEEREVVYSWKPDGSCWISREGEEHQYEVKPHYRVYRRDEPQQSFEEIEAIRYDGLDAAVCAANEDLQRVTKWVMENEGVDFPDAPSELNFNEFDDNAYVAREYDTVGCDWRIEFDGYSIFDVVNGGDEYWANDEGDIEACIERDIDNGWF